MNHRKGLTFVMFKQEENDLTKTILNFHKEIDVKKIVTIFYREFSSTYVYEGERHNFWEFLYVDKGKVDVVAAECGYRLKQGDIIFHQPNEFHSIMGVEGIASNAIIVSFVCRSESMNFFREKIIQLTENERYLVGSILKEAYGAYKRPLSFLADKNRLDKPVQSAAEQMMYLHLEQLLIVLMRQKNPSTASTRMSLKTQSKIESEMVKAIIRYMEEHLYERLNLSDICSAFLVSKTKLKTMFKDYTGQSTIDYYRVMKLEKSKELIRSNTMNFTEIAHRLGYDSIHYFSRSFKQQFDMSPTEYKNSVDAFEELH